MDYKQIMDDILSEAKTQVTYALIEKYISEINKSLDKNKNKRINLSDYKKYKNDTKAMNDFFKIKEENGKYNLYSKQMGSERKVIDLLVADVTEYFK